MEKTYLSKDGFEKLSTELQNLKTRRRHEISRQLSMARSFGDVSENAEYETAKHAMNMNEIRILELEQKLANAEIISQESVRADKVYLGSKVVVWDIDFDEEVRYEITGTDEADPAHDKISVDSPVARGLLGHSIGDRIEIKVPRGVLRYEVRKIAAS